MNLHDVMKKINAMDNFISILPNRSTCIDDYCKRHPYFESTVRKINSMYRYIDFKEVLNTMEHIVSDRFIDILDLNNNERKYVFIYEGRSKSCYYFTLLFLKYLSDVLNVAHWDKIIIQEYSHNTQWDSKNHESTLVLVDDAAYSGRQILTYASIIPNPIVILVACSQYAYDLLKYIRGITLLVGIIEANVFEIDLNDIFKD